MSLSSKPQRSFDHIVILTGAGVSAESGVATFRDADGLWENHDPMTIATPEAFERDPDLVYRFYNARLSRLSEVQPNAAHLALARLQRDYPGNVFLVTQNVDDLHERGGAGQVCHMHGQLRQIICNRCHNRDIASSPYDGTTACGGCGHKGCLRPDVVWFGEIPYDMSLIEAQLSRCNLFVAIGTSGVVYPAAGFVQLAASYGAHTLEINREVSEVGALFDEHREGLATVEVVAWVEELLAGTEPAN
jgi:NAD-dependent deacetylase